MSHNLNSGVDGQDLCATSQNISCSNTSIYHHIYDNNNVVHILGKQRTDAEEYYILEHIWLVVVAAEEYHWDQKSS